MAKPANRACTVIKRESNDDNWLNVGLAFPHEDGEGFNLLLQALPLDGKIVLRIYKEEEEEKDKRNDTCAEPSATPAASFSG
jgi:hypothetical protein